MLAWGQNVVLALFLGQVSVQAGAGITQLVSTFTNVHAHFSLHECAGAPVSAAGFPD